MVAGGQITSSPLDDSDFSSRRMMSITSNAIDRAQVLSEKTATQYESVAVSLESTSQNTNIYNGFQMFTQETVK